jgi:hypothetical protein
LKIRDPTTFSKHFGVRRSHLKSLGAIDVTLNVDTKLFIDPLLLEASKQPEMIEARTAYTGHFADIVKLLAASKQNGDVAWRAARERLRFHEFAGTCLGYGAASTQGSGFGPQLTSQLLTTAKEIIDLGVTDPDLFMLLSLFEDGVGPDRISDMATNVILPQLVAYTDRVLDSFRLPRIKVENGQRTFSLPANPFNRRGGLVLVPRDVVRALPIARDWSDVSTVAGKNAALRRRINADIGNTWAGKTKEQKALVRTAIRARRSACETFLEVLRAVPKTAYDFDKDPQGHVAWTDFIRMSTEQAPLDLSAFRGASPSIENTRTLVERIVEQFKYLVEKKGLAKEFWSGSSPRPEKSAQRLFFAVADSYCKANNVDVTPEADSGSGPVDFKFSAGYAARVLVELKLSSNSKVVAGYESQLDAYKDAEETPHGVYVVIDLGDLGSRDETLVRRRNALLAKGRPASDLVFIDGSVKASASKR